MTRRDGFVYEFEPTWGNLRALRDRFGNWVRITTGGGQANLSRIEASNGRWLAFTYGGSGIKIAQIQDNLGRTWSYTYEQRGRAAADGDRSRGRRHRVHVRGYHRMLTIKDARNIVFLTNEYDATGG